MSETYTKAVEELAENQPEKLATALVSAAYLRDVAPEHFEEKLIPEASDEVNDALMLVAAALTILSSTGELSELGSSQDIVDVLEDDRMRFVLTGTALNILSDVKENPDAFKDAGLDPDGDLRDAFKGGKA